MDQLSEVYGFVERVADELMLNEKMCMTLNLALEEAVTNVIKYAYPRKKGEDNIIIRLEKKEDRLKITVMDSGIHFNPTKKERPDTSLPLQERKIGGLGILLIDEIMTKVSYRRRDNRNILTMTKELD